MNKSKNTKENESRGQRIKAIRKNKGLTQRDLARVLDISLPMVKKIESGESTITIAELTCLKDNFNVSADYILFGEVINRKHFEYHFQSASTEEKMQIFLSVLFQLCGADNEKFIAFLIKTIESVERNNNKWKESNI